VAAKRSVRPGRGASVAGPGPAANYHGFLALAATQALAVVKAAAVFGLAWM
jgi:hypothetical protein